MRRLLIGAVSHASVAVTVGAATFGPVVAMETGDRTQAARIAQLGQVVDNLRVASHGLRATSHATAKAWRAQLDTLLKDFTASPAALAWTQQDLKEKLDTLLPEAEGTPIERGALRRMLEAGFTLPLPGPSENCGAVTMNPLNPHLARPFKVVVLLGMNDGTFPRRPTPRRWDPFATFTQNLVAKSTRPRWTARCSAIWPSAARRCGSLTRPTR